MFVPDGWINHITTTTTTEDLYSVIGRIKHESEYCKDCTFVFPSVCPSVPIPNMI